MQTHFLLFPKERTALSIFENQITLEADGSTGHLMRTQSGCTIECHGIHAKHTGRVAYYSISFFGNELEHQLFQQLSTRLAKYEITVRPSKWDPRSCIFNFSIKKMGAENLPISDRDLTVEAVENWIVRNIGLQVDRIVDIRSGTETYWVDVIGTDAYLALYQHKIMRGDNDCRFAVSPSPEADTLFFRHMIGLTIFACSTSAVHANEILLLLRKKGANVSVVANEKSKFYLFRIILADAASYGSVMQNINISANRCIEIPLPCNTRVLLVAQSVERIMAIFDPPKAVSPPKKAAAPTRQPPPLPNDVEEAMKKMRAE